MGVYELVWWQSHIHTSWRGTAQLQAGGFLGEDVHKEAEGGSAVALGACACLVARGALGLERQVVARDHLVGRERDDGVRGDCMRERAISMAADLGGSLAEELD